MPRHQLQTTGGTKNWAIYSGSAALNDQLVVSGTGRLASVTLHQSVLAMSGVGLQIYDSNIATSGGPFAASGHKIFANPLTPQGVSGQHLPAGVPFPVGTYYETGICVATRSGQPGVTLSYTPEF